MLSLYLSLLAFAPAPLRRPQMRTSIVGMTELAPVKEELMSLLLDGLKTKPDTGQFGECLLALERGNPTPEPARSSLLNGVWSLQYAGALSAGVVDSPTREIALSIYSSSYSAGVLQQLLSKLPFDAGLMSAAITIVSPEAGQPRVSTEASIAILGSTQTLKFGTNLQPVSGVRLREVFVEAEAFGQRGLLPGPLAFSRQLFVTYLDEEMMVMRDESGVADVLVRKDTFLDAEPSYTDADEAPGAG